MNMHKFLREHRKRSPLTQNDLGFLMGLDDYSNVSRWESGLRTPKPEVLVTYHVLFDVPMESLFEGRKGELAGELCPRIKLRLEELKAYPTSQNVRKRIFFLENALKRLSE